MFQVSSLIFLIFTLISKHLIIFANNLNNTIIEHHNRRHWHQNHHQASVLCRVPRVFNGEYATKAIHSVVSMEHKPKWWFMDYEHVCGGALISSHFVVSSAHCFTGKRMVTHVGVGSICRSKMQHYDIEVIFIHYDYNDYCCLFDNDIAVVRTKKVIGFVNADTLPTLNRYELSPLKKGVVYGWGKTETGNYSNTLKKTHLTFFRISGTCRNKPLLCAYPTVNTSLKEGDSGSPVFSLDRRFVLGIHIGRVNDYTVISSIAYFYNWITFVMYEYRDILLLTEKIPLNKVIRCCNATVMNETKVYQMSGLPITIGRNSFKIT